MKFVFFGSPEFAAMVLDKIISAGFAPEAIVCNPDRPVGRKQVITPPETKKLILERGLADKIKVLQPEKPSLILSDLQAMQPDFFVVAAYAKIISKAVLDIPRLGTVGVHPSLLPKYRGASPIQSAILSGEKETGVALYLLGPGVDDGPVFAEENLSIAENENYAEILPRLAELGGRMLAELIPALLNESAKPLPQDEDEATLTKKFTGEDGFVPEEEIAAAMHGDSLKVHAVHNKIRALGEEPGVWTLKNGKRIKLLSSELENGALRIRRIQKEGGVPEDNRGAI